MNRQSRVIRSKGAAFKQLVTLLYERLLDLPRNTKQGVLLAFDIVSIPVSFYVATAVRLGVVNPGFGIRESIACLVTMFLSAVIFLRLGLYRAIVRFMGLEAILAILKGVTLSTGILTMSMFLSQSFMPRSLPFIYWCLMLLVIGAPRLLLRSYYQWQKKQQSQRVAIYGAGAAGRQLLTALRHGERFDPVLFIDDNPALQGRVINGVMVTSLQALPQWLEANDIVEVFLAIASASTVRRREIIRALADMSVQVRTIPTFEDIVSGKADIAEVREISLEDLLGRDPVPPYPDLLARCIDGKVVMVTGAGGSIGSELCRQILEEGPAELLLFDSSEFALYNIERELRELSVKLGCRTEILPMLGSVQDSARLQLIMRGYRVQTVYHAAAYKHVPIVEFNVVEGVRNNVLGTQNAARAAAECGVETFVLVSTDKAVRPLNIMGASKRIAEMVLQAHAANGCPTRFVIVRFGNVLGSSGSVVPLFREQIRNGGPLTVTHEDVHRYFMTIPEAAQLVLQAGSMGSGGDVFVLDMGEPIRIVDLARRMVRLSGMEVRDEHNPQGDIEIHVTGLRPGEKLFEELLVGDNVSATGHPMILRALEDYLPWAEMDDVVQQIEAACTIYDCDRIRNIFSRTVVGFDNRYGCSDPLARRLQQTGARGPARVERLFPGRRA